MDGSNATGKISTSTRWAPTVEQIKLLKELYYTNGLRTPTADHIHTICARLRRYGKVKAKNVFYWFQNHKARERQKKKLTPNNNSSSNPSLSSSLHHNNTIVGKRITLHQWKEDQGFSRQRKIFSINNFEISFPCSSADVGCFTYGSMKMESKVKELTAPNSSKISTKDNEDHDKSPEIETLPLFPTSNEEQCRNNHRLKKAGFCDIKTGSDSYNKGSYWWIHGNGGENIASLELRLNSYGCGCYAPNV